MQSSSNKHIMFIIYDGIENSVFQSQVLTPLLSLLNETSNLDVTLVSFEKKRPTNTQLSSTIPPHDHLHLVLCRRLPFLGKWSLRFAAYQLKKLLEFIPCNQIIARGPLAGHVALTALHKLSQKHPERLRSNNPQKFPELTVQARGLCAEEYRYAEQKKLTSWLGQHWYSHIYKSLKTIEFEVYRNKRKTDFPNHVIIEAVSPALKDYLTNSFRADPTKITIATRDLPKNITPNQVRQWRVEVRRELCIPENAIVYCYSGSFKAWQCAKETIEAFAYEYSRDKNSFMLVLTLNQKPFIAELERLKIPSMSYKVMSVYAADLYRYLSAGDYGMLLREKDIINWVSRPTKMLEYQAVGLKVVHNNTIAWLAGKE